MKKVIKKQPQFLIFITFLVSLIIVGLTIAKYVDKQKNNLVYEASAFYFESDELSENENKNYTYGTGENSIIINLKNYEDELRWANVDIEYKVIITDSNEKEIEEKTGKLVKGSKNENKIEFDNLETGTYKVTAMATEPYTKTLSGTFSIVAKNNEITYQVNDSKDSSVLYLTVLTNDYSGKVKLTFPNEIIPNNMENEFLELTETTATLEFESNSEYNIQFFKKDSSKTYTKEEILAERGE